MRTEIAADRMCRVALWLENKCDGYDTAGGSVELIRFCRTVAIGAFGEIVKRAVCGLRSGGRMIVVRTAAPVRIVGGCFAF